MKKLLKPSKLLDSSPPIPPLLSTLNPPLKEEPNSLINKTLKLPNYTVTIEEVIAEGGFGIVFLAKSNKSNFALKRIVVNNPGDLEVAEREVRFLSSLTVLKSPHLLPLLDAQTNKLTNEISEVISLTVYCKSNLLNLLNKCVASKCPLAEDRVLRVFSDIVQAISHLHSQSTPIIHRDLKVENVLENGVGGWLLCDFGSATTRVWDPLKDPITKIQEDLEKYTTLAYRAPEMVDLYSGRGPLTVKCDIWALGVLVYKTCTLTTPFGDSLLAIQNAKPTTLPNYTTSLQTAINYMLIPEAEQRPDIFQVSTLLHSPELLNIPNPIASKSHWTFAEINEYLSVEHSPVAAAASVTVDKKIIVLETSVTPRQRPKPGLVLEQQNLAETTLVTQELPPPKETNSWNPFEGDAFATATKNDDTEQDDPFANAPFDFFKYQPIDEALVKGVTNYSFEDL